MAQPCVTATNKLRIKLKGVPRVQNGTQHKGGWVAFCSWVRLQQLFLHVFLLPQQHGMPKYVF